MNKRRKSTTDKIEKLLEKKFGKKLFYRVFEVTIVDGDNNYGRVDYVLYEKYKTWKFFEIKSCKDDFYSDAKWTFLGEYNYFVFPQGLYKEVKDDVPEYVGVYEVNDKGTNLRSVKSAKRRKLKIDEELIMNRFIISLCRDFENYRELKTMDTNRRLKNRTNDVIRLKKNIDKTEKKNDKLMELLLSNGYTKKELLEYLKDT